MNSTRFSRGFPFTTSLFFFWFCLGLGAQTRPVAVLGGTLIDGTGGAPVTDSAILMQGGRFQEVGKRGEVSIPQGAEVIEAGGKTILPGLIDGHCHYQDWAREMSLAYGVTTCPDLLGNEDPKWILDQREAIRKGVIRGPRIWATGMHVDGPPLSEAGAAKTEYPGIVRTPEEARSLVRKLGEMGVDGFKFYERMTPELAKVAAAEANRLGLPVFGHSVDIFASANAGYQGVEHFWSVVITSIQNPQKKEEMIRGEARGAAGLHDLNSSEFHLYMEPDFYRYIEPKMFDRIIRVMVESNIHWSPTWETWFWPLSPRAAVLKQEELALLKDPRFSIPPEAASRAEGLIEFYEKTTPERRAQVLDAYRGLQGFARRFVAAGGKIHAGSDPNRILPAFGLQVELELLMEAGLSPSQVIQATSLNVAQAWRKDKDYGSVEKGKVADLAIVRGDPTKDISVFRNVEMVFQDGKLVAGSNYSKP